MEGADAPLADAALNPTSIVTPKDTPAKLRCARCNEIAINAFRLPCCDQNVCEPCIGKLTSTCPVCDHSPLDPAACKPNKNTRLTVKVFLKKEEKKEEQRRELEKKTPSQGQQAATPDGIDTPIAATEGEGQVNGHSATTALEQQLGPADGNVSESLSKTDDRPDGNADTEVPEVLVESPPGSPCSETSSIEITLAHQGDEPERVFGKGSARVNQPRQTAERPSLQQRESSIMNKNNNINNAQSRTHTPVPKGPSNHHDQAQSDNRANHRSAQSMDNSNWQNNQGYNSAMGTGQGMNMANATPAMWQNYMMGMSGMTMDQMQQMMMAQSMFQGAPGMGMPGMMGMNGGFGQNFNGWNTDMNGAFGQNAAYFSHNGSNNQSQWGQTNQMHGNNYIQNRTRGQRGDQNFAGRYNGNVMQGHNGRQGFQRNQYPQNNYQQQESVPSQPQYASHQVVSNDADGAVMTNDSKADVRVQDHQSQSDVNEERSKPEAGDSALNGPSSSETPAEAPRSIPTFESTHDEDRGNAGLEITDGRGPAGEYGRDTALDLSARQDILPPTGPAAPLTQSENLHRGRGDSIGAGFDANGATRGRGNGRFAPIANGHTNHSTEINPPVVTLGVVGAPTGPKAMREKVALPRGIFRGRGGSQVGGAPMLHTVSSVAIPSGPAASTRLSSVAGHDLKTEAAARDSIPRSVDDGNSRQRHVDQSRHASPGKADEPRDKRHHKSRHHSREPSVGRSSRHRSEKEKHRSSHADRETSRERRHRRHRSRSRSPGTEEKDRSRRKSKRDDHHDSERNETHDKRREYRERDVVSKEKDVKSSGHRDRDRDREKEKESSGRHRESRDTAQQREKPPVTEFKIKDRSKKSQLDVEMDNLRRENPNMDVYSLEREARTRERLAKEQQRRESVVTPKGPAVDRKRSYAAVLGELPPTGPAEHGSRKRAKVRESGGRRSSGKYGESDEARALRVEAEREAARWD